MFTLDTAALLDTRLIKSPDESQLWCSGPSLWSLIAEHVAGSELAKIHTALGHFLVDMYTEVHAEAEMWHKMWQESQRGGNNGSRAGTPLPHQKGSPLADPPAVKELVRAEVKMLLLTLRERASRGGRDGEELLFQYKPETVNYALSHLDSCYSTCTNPGDTDNGSRPSSHCSVQSSAADEIEAVRDKLNVTDIEQVVDRLKSVLMEECEVLNRLVKQLKRNIKQNCRSECEFDKSEPTLEELRDLRGAIKMDLELYPSSYAASPPALTSLPVKELKNRFRLSAGQKASDETLRALNATSVLRPHPPPPLCHPIPRPPTGPPLTKTSASVKPVHSSSLSRAHGQCRGTLASNKSGKTPLCSKNTTSGHVKSHFTTDQIRVESEYLCSPSQEQNSAGLNCGTPTSSASFRIKTLRNSPVHVAHLSSHRSIHSPSREFDSSPQRQRKSSSVWRSRNINITSSPVSALSPLCDAGSYSNSTTDYSGSATEKSETQNEQKKSTCGGGLVSKTLQVDNDSKNSTPESFNSSVMSETGKSPARNGDRKSNSGTDRNRNGQDVSHQQSLSGHCLTDWSSHHSESSEEGQGKCTQHLNGQFFTSSKRPLGGTTGEPKSVQEAQTELEFIGKFYQPVPPARVST
ncbi:coiled-coil domain-containing protein 24 isoform X2 [Xiphias gladius]|uniref:coiled-coil domain-containing protein 24 isoform X2 n=1 Tax=Xiphias gladius TaxID=8245 RepID=UPI001A97E19B|nr:coiled-coil domain-containing protein 24 isoform X2 [Xiphias gladius]